MSIKRLVRKYYAYLPGSYRESLTFKNKYQHSNFVPMVKPSVRPTLTIKLKPQYQDYIRYLMKIEGYGSSPHEMMAFRGSYLGKLIAPFLQFMPLNYKPLIEDGSREFFTFMLPIYDEFEVRNNTAWISERNQRHIERIVDAHFRIHFMTYAMHQVTWQIEVNNNKKGYIQKTIIKFCADVNMVYDETTYDLISKSFFRTRKKYFENDKSLTGKTAIIGHLFHLV